MITSLAPLPTTNSTDTSPSTQKLRQSFKVRIAADFEMGDYVVAVDVPDADKVVRRICGFSGGSIFLEQMGATPYLASQWNWASEEAIDAAVAAGTVSGDGE